MAHDYTRTPRRDRAVARAVPGHPAERHRAAVHRRVLGQPRAGHLRRRGLRRAVVRLGRQVRQRLRAGPVSPSRSTTYQRRREARLQPSDDPHRGALGARRQPPRPRVQRRAARRGRVALLHQLRFAEIHPPRRPRGRGVRRLQGLCSTTVQGGQRERQQDGDPGRRLLLGHAGPDPQAARRGVDPRRLHRRPERPRDLPQPSRPRRGHRDRLRPGPDRLPRAAGVLLPDPRSDARRTVRATTSAPATGRRSSTSTTSRSGSRWTPSPMSTRPGCGRARWSPRSPRPATSGRPSPSTRTTCSTTRTATPATSPRPGWKLPKRAQADATGPVSVRGGVQRRCTHDAAALLRGERHTAANATSRPARSWSRW